MSKALNRRHILFPHRHLNRLWANPRGLGRLTVVNHSVLGLRFILTALGFFFIGGILAMLIRAQLATSGNAFLDHALYNQIFTMHGTVMMFLFAIPLIEGFAIYLLPKMLGARDLAYPRLSAFGYWCYLLGGLLLIGALAVGLAPDSGWFMYTPLSSKTYTPGVNADVWLLGVTFVEISAVCAAVEIMASILAVRTAGMGLKRLPLFAWYMLVTAGMMLIGFPPLILGSILLEIERAFDWPFFDAARGGDSLLWQHLFWLFGHPEVYIIFLPAAGIVSTLIPVFAGRPIVGYTWIVAAALSMGFISFGLWVHHMFTVGIPHLAQVFFSAASMLVAVPTAVQFFAWIATLWSGRPRLGLPMLYLFGFLVIFVAGGLTGVMLALVPFDWQVHDTHFVVAHLHYVLIGGFLFPILAGLYYWFPLVVGRLPSPRLGVTAFVLIFVGFNLTFLIMHLTGLLGMPRRVYVYGSEAGWDLPNLVSSIGSFIMSMGFVLVAIDLLLSRHSARRAPPNPWQADTLEWAMPTPPPPYNIISQPLVNGRNPLWQNPQLPAEMAGGGHLLTSAGSEERETLGVEPISGRPVCVIALPGQSWLPFAGGLALALFFLSLLLRLYWVTGAAILIALFVFLRWAWSNGLRQDPAPIDIGHGHSLPQHSISPLAPGWLGLIFTLTADATLFASLLFGYVYLWAVAPNWPPPVFIDQDAAGLAALAGVALLLFAAGPRLAERALTQQQPARCRRWLGTTGVLGLAATLLLLFAILPALPPPQLHAYAAVVAFMAGYGAFHCGLGAVIAAFVLARARAGFLSPRRRLDLRLLRLWCDYSVVAGLLILLAAFALPELLA